jgi:amidase
MTPTSGLEHLSGLDLSARIVAGEVTVPEVVADALERAHADTFGAWVHIDDEGAMAQAEELQRQLADPDFAPGPLFGVPCPIKDLNSADGMPMEGGSAALRGHLATWDDGVVTRLKEAGTVAIGKTSTPEFGLPCYTEPEGHDPAVTPWDPTRMAGGSSGGAAASVAAGQVPIAQGSDGGGSIRIPASCCGLVGLKPSRGRVSTGPYAIDGPGLGSAGVLSRTVRDTAAALDILSVGWPGDPYPAPAPAGSYLSACDHPVGKLRIGVLAEPVISDTAIVHPAVTEALTRTVSLLTDLGHDVEPAPRPFTAEQWDSFKVVWAVGAASIQIPEDAEDQLRPLTRWLRNLGAGYSALELARAMDGIQKVTRRTAELWDDFDVVICPTLAQPPLPVGAIRDDADPAADFDAQCEFTPWSSIWNLTGRPAISLPLRTARIDGVELPIGITVGARMNDETLLLALSAQLEEAVGPTGPSVS